MIVQLNISLFSGEEPFIQSLFIHAISFIHSSDICLSAHYLPGTVLSVEDSVVKKESVVSYILCYSHKIEYHLP